MKNAISYYYYADHIKPDNNIEVEISRKIVYLNIKKYHIDLNPINVFILKTRIRSRHSKSVKY